MCAPLSDYFNLKKDQDAEKIQNFEASGCFKHGYDYVEWRLWTGNNYIKSYYDVMLEDGTILEHCVANAGVMRVGMRKFDANSNVRIRLSLKYPYVK